MPQNVAEMAAWRMFTFVLGMNLYAMNSTAMYMHVVSTKIFTSRNRPSPSKNEEMQAAVWQRAVSAEQAKIPLSVS
jgi:hypothetical protein